jgi:hypothetical protein
VGDVTSGHERVDSPRSCTIKMPCCETNPSDDGEDEGGKKGSFTPGVYVEDDVENEALGFIEKNFFILKRASTSREEYAFGAGAPGCIARQANANALQETGDHRSSRDWAQKGVGKSAASRKTVEELHQRKQDE